MLFAKDPSITKGAWTNGKETITGEWRYNWASDNFSIWLDSKDPITGEKRFLISYDDEPRWGNWRLVRDKK